MTIEAFLVHQLRAVGARHELVVVANAPDSDLLKRNGINGLLVSIKIVRQVNVWMDVLALWRLVQLFRRSRFDLVHSVTPKAGLLAAMAGTIAGVPARIHTFTGQVWVTQHGIRRAVLRFFDRLVARLDTAVLVDSESQLRFLERECIVPAGKGSVLLNGSISGVDVERFSLRPTEKARMRAALGYDDQAICFLFVGRLTRDKGVAELVEAFARVWDLHPHVGLVIVGPDEGGLKDELIQLAGRAASHMQFVGFSPSPERYMWATDVFVLPSYREGFGTVVIEAGAAGLPTVATNIYGLTDAVVDGVTGLLVEPRDAHKLAAAMCRLVEDASLRVAMGQAARTRSVALFHRDRLTAALIERYERALSARP